MCFNISNLRGGLRRAASANFIASSFCFLYTLILSPKANESNNTSVNFYAVPRCFDKAFPVLWGKSSAEGAISLNAGGFLINATIELISLLSKKDVDPEECKSFEEDKAEINKQIMRSPGFKK